MTLQLCSFKIEENLFGINVLLVREINSNLDITPVDLAPPEVEGLLNLRGQIVTVLNMAKVLGLTIKPRGPQSRIIILKTNTELDKYRQEGYELEKTPLDLVGLLVDSIEDMITVEEENQEKIPANLEEIESTKIKSVIQLNQGLVALVNVEAI